MLGEDWGKNQLLFPGLGEFYLFLNVPVGLSLSIFAIQRKLGIVSSPEFIICPAASHISMMVPLMLSDVMSASSFTIACVLAGIRKLRNLDAFSSLCFFDPAIGFWVR